VSTQTILIEKVEPSIDRVMRASFWSSRSEPTRPAEVIDLAQWRSTRRASV
jgi:hypothetical protein